MLYLDASALVAILAREAKSDAVLQHLTASEAAPAVSTWTCTEARSAFALKARTGALTVEQATAAGATLTDAVGADFKLEAVRAEDVGAAATFLAPGGPALRAGDALHLAIARRLEAELLTLDQGLARAAAAFGIAAVLL